jgi:hypothetical protein
MSTEEQASPTGNRRRWKKGAATGAGVAVLASVFAANGGPVDVSASSHREAPLIAGDPRSDNTDVYAFVSPDRPDTATIITTWGGSQEPGDWASAAWFDPDVTYWIKVDNTGDSVADITWTFRFLTQLDAPASILATGGVCSAASAP